MKILLLILSPLSLFALETMPWFDEIYSGRLTAGYTYSEYPKVANATKSQKGNDRLYFLSLDLVPKNQWSTDAEIEFANTSHFSTYLRSGAVQARYLFLDDVAGDMVSLALGLSLRAVPGHSLHDVSTPYHSNMNLEAGLSVGKEFSKGAFWVNRYYGFLAIGEANKGNPWLRAIASAEMNNQDRHQAGLSLLWYQGFGNEKNVHIKNFHGYAYIHHQSLDIELYYRYLFPIWGNLRLAYSYRPYALSYPTHTNSITLTYTLPF